MKEEGYDVTGITLKLYDDSKQSKEGRQCCAGQDILDAKRVSEKIDINHKILFYQKNLNLKLLILLLIVMQQVKHRYPVFNAIKQ